MVREYLDLDGTWDFHFDRDAQLAPVDVEKRADWRAIYVPGPWQAQFDDLREAAGTAWYRRSFTAHNTWQDRMVILHFGAVNYRTQVWINGHYVGEHEGGYSPFELDLSAHVHFDTTNDLLVRVTVPSDNPDRFPDFPFAEIPHGKQSWYGIFGGIWQSVRIETRSPQHITRITLAPDLETSNLLAHLMLTAAEQNTAQVLRIRILAPDGTLASEDHHIVSPGTQQIELSPSVQHALPWTPDTPNLYHFQATLVANDVVIDEHTETFGFRTIETRDGKLYLNGDLLYLRGALDQDYYPSTICTPPSEKFLEDQFRKAKAMGLNCVRCHIKIPDPRYLDIADRIGMLVWLDIPNTKRLTSSARARLQHTLENTIERDFNHPSIIIWTIINEDWGTDLVYDQDHRQWLQNTYQWLKKRDPSRLVIDNSACAPNFHIQTDIEDYHFYRAMPDHRHDWDNIIEQFANRASWTFSPHGDAIRSGKEPLVVSEFGNWGLPDTTILTNNNTCEPWWFETGMDWGDGIAYPHGAQQRFYAWHLDRIFGSWQSLIAATQWQQYSALKYQIESMRRYPQLAGYVITELTDVYWEANGLLDMERNPRVFCDALTTLNADTVVLCTWNKLAYWSGEKVCIGIQISHAGNKPLEDAVVKWQVKNHDISGITTVPALAPGDVAPVDEIVFDAPSVKTGQLITLELMLESAHSDTVATNQLTLTVFPPRNQTPQADLELWIPDPELREYSNSLGYHTTSSLETADLVLTRQLTDTLTTYVREGGRLVLLADSEDSIPICAPGQQVIEPCFPYTQMIARKGTFWAGDWVSSFLWLRRDKALSHLPGGPLLDFAFENIMPEYVLTGFSQQDFEAHVHAGMFLGWIHKNVAVLAERHYGAGKAIVTTFSLLQQEPGVDPIATILLDSLIMMGGL